MAHKKIYLATAYSGIEEESYKIANEVAAHLIKEGHFVFSPITHSHPISLLGITENTYDTWLRQDKVFVDWAEEIRVIVIVKDGDREYGTNRIANSKGVQRELKWAKEQGKPITYIDYHI